MKIKSYCCYIPSEVDYYQLIRLFQNPNSDRNTCDLAALEPDWYNAPNEKGFDELGNVFRYYFSQYLLLVSAIGSKIILFFIWY
jgi:hypothetical protein